MKSKEEFKIFVKSHPQLINYVKNNEMTWQKFYELYCLYDEDDNVWNSYLNNNESTVNKTNNNSNNNFTDIFNMIKNIKPETIQQNISSIQKFLGFISDMILDGTNKDTSKPRNIYTPRPTHKMFED